MSLAVTGFECEFIEQPPEVLQFSCPICLLILREPYQVTCCGNSFCRWCIQQIKTRNKPCPTCNQKNFTDYSNLGLQQPLYGFKVYCSNKDDGCDWQGELGQLDKHLNLNPDQEIGCSYTKVKCLHCSELYQRRSIKCHQIFKCLLRPFTCKMCKEFKSTYEDVTKNHTPSCKCRSVECLNACGNTIPHQDLQEHLSSVCPLSMVECEFSHAGCDAKMYKKDLPSHLSESTVTHMSLLARENKRLNTEVTSLARENERLNLLIIRDNENQSTEIRKLKLELQFTRLASNPRVPPIDFKLRTGESSQPFYSHICGYKLKVAIEGNIFLFLTFTMLESEFEVKSSYNLSITAMVIDQVNNKDHETYNLKLSYPSKTAEIYLSSMYMKDGCYMIRITDITIE